MATNMKNSFLFYYDWEEIIDSLTDNQAGKIIKAMLDHSRGEKVELKPYLASLFISFRQMLDRNKENYDHVSEVRRNSANIRWAGSKNAIGMQTDATDANAYDKDKDKDIHKKNTLKTENPYKVKKTSSDLKGVSVPATSGDIFDILTKASAQDNRKRRYYAK